MQIVNCRDESSYTSESMLKAEYHRGDHRLHCDGRFSRAEKMWNFVCELNDTTLGKSLKTLYFRCFVVLPVSCIIQHARDGMNRWNERSYLNRDCFDTVEMILGNSGLWVTSEFAS